MVNTRGNPGHEEEGGGRNAVVTGNRRGRGGNQQRGSGKRRGGMSHQFQGEREAGQTVGTSGVRRSAHSRLGSRLNEENEVENNESQQPIVEDDSDNEDDQRQQPSTHVHMTVSQTNVLGSSATGQAVQPPGTSANASSSTGPVLGSGTPGTPPTGPMAEIMNKRRNRLGQNKTRREVLRTSVKRVQDQLTALTEEVQFDEFMIKIKLDKLDQELSEIRSLDQRIMEALCEDPDQQSVVLNAEQAEAEQVQESALYVKYAVLKKTDAGRGSTATGSDCGENKRKLPLKLPKKTVAIFDGSIENWPSWWGQFRVLHESDEVSAVEKLQVLIQSMQEGSSAHTLIRHFPIEEEYYEVAIKALKRRFGNNDQIIQALVQGAIKLINEAAAGNQDFVRFVDELQSKLKIIKTMGKDALQQCQYLYTQVEGALSEEMIERWEREKLKISCEPEGTVNKLDRLMSFLDTEVLVAEQKKRAKNAKMPEEKRFIPTAASLVATTSKTQQPSANKMQAKGNGNRPDFKDKAKCTFCGKNHPSKECWSAAKMSHQEKLAKIRKSGTCFICFKFGHQAKECRSKVHCNSCGKRHNVIMCKGVVAAKGPRNDQASNQTSSKQQDRKVEFVDANQRKRKLSSNVNQNRRVEFDDEQPSTSRGQGRQPARTVQYEEEDEEKELTRDDLKKVKKTFSCIGVSRGDQVRLQTVQLLLEGPRGSKLCRAILDTGAQKSAVTSSALKAVGSQQVASFTTQHSLYGGRSTRVVRHGVFEASIKSTDGKFSMPVSVIDEKKIIEELPTIDKKSAGKLAELGIHLTDFGEEKEVDLLLGNDIFGSLLTGETRRVRLGDSQEFVTALNTHFGWVVSGELKTLDESELTMATLLGTLSVNQMFDLDVIGVKDPIETKTKQEIQEDIKAYFLQTVQRDQQGRYVVEWPWTMDKKLLPNNFPMAMARLKSAAKKLQESGVYDQYEQVFMDWLEEGIIEEIPAENFEAAGCHYLPHRGVIKMDSLTTKLRPVFDASAKTSRSYSLNDLLAKGPNMLELIPDLIMRFMLGQVAAVSDIRKAFLQIELQEDQRDVVRFIWFSPDRKTIRVFRHKRVVFGVNCSPFLLAAVLEKHLMEATQVYKKTAKKLLESLYVDNCVASFESVQDYLKFRNASVKLLADGKFDLRMWESNVDGDTAAEVTKVLGVQWDKKNDTLSPSIIKIQVPERLTKKTLLAVSHSLFDPTGMFAPVSLIPKQLMREACLAGLDWDEDLPDELQKKFTKWCNEVVHLKKISIPRPMADVNPSTGSWSLHVFCDASKTAFATVVFVRVETEEGVTVRFLQARTRLAPIKEKTSIPRMELLSAGIGARLGTSIKNALRCNWPITFWSDSMTVLQWIRSYEVWGVFVDNRVKEIRQLTNITDWRHVPGKMNPADVPSRGLTAKKFAESEWLQGPKWLAEERSKWPKEESNPSGDFQDEHGGRNYRKEAFEERRKTAALVNSSGSNHSDSGEVSDSEETADELPWYENGGSYTDVIRNLAKELKASASQNDLQQDDNAMDIDQEETPMDLDAKDEELSPRDFNAAEAQAWKWIQEEAKVSKMIKKPLKAEKRNGLWCVNTRLSLREDSEAFLWPVYLPSSHPLVKKLIQETHEKLGHAGPGIVIAELRKRVWIQQGRKNANMVIAKCLVCRMHNAKKLTATEAPLPQKRITMGKVFETTGVDYAGPLHTRSGEKVYFSLFTCATYRAIHLELVEDATTEAFSQAIRRFRNRRGVPKNICSDNGTNFRGYENLMSKIDWKKIKADFEFDRIRWDFNPPAAPWWGGYWERLVGIVKGLLRRIFGNRVLDKEELRTVLTDVEMVVNSRPLTYLSEKDDLIPLTPNSFLMDVPWAEAVDMDEVEQQGFQRRYQYRQQLREELRQRFRLEYLGSLKSHVDNKNHAGLQVNDVVMIETTENKRRMAWPIGRIVELIPGVDGVVRLVKVKTQSGEMLRAVQRLVPLGSELLPEQAEKVKEVAKKMQLKSPEDEVVVQQALELDEESVPAEYCTRSGRVSRQPDRLCYTLAGFEIIE